MSLAHAHARVYHVRHHRYHKETGDIMNTYRIVFICTLLAACFWAGGCSQKTTPGEEPASRIGYTELTNLQASGKQVVLLDIRRDDEVARGMIPGAKHIPLAELKLRIHEVPTNAVVVIYCASGKRVPKAVPILKAAGHTALYDFISVTNWRGTLARPR